MENNVKKIIAVIFLFVFQGCYKDKEEILYPEKEDCDTSQVTYLLVVSPIIVNNCLSCHGNASHRSLGGNLNMEGYQNILRPVNNGIFLRSLMHETGISPMPKNATKLSDCHISQIKKWIDSGAPNN